MARMEYLDSAMQDNIGDRFIYLMLAQPCLTGRQVLPRAHKSGKDGVKI
jgi:hypothetical protein